MRLIDADALLDKTVKKNGAWKSTTNSEGKNLEEIVSEMPIIQFVPIDVLDKIRAEILVLDDADYDYEGYYKAVTDALKIIDKYRGESKDAGSN